MSQLCNGEPTDGSEEANRINVSLLKIGHMDLKIRDNSLNGALGPLSSLRVNGVKLH